MRDAIVWSNRAGNHTVAAARIAILFQAGCGTRCEVNFDLQIRWDREILCVLKQDKTNTAHVVSYAAPHVEF